MAVSIWAVVELVSWGLQSYEPPGISKIILQPAREWSRVDQTHSGTELCFADSRATKA